MRLFDASFSDSSLFYRLTKRCLCKMYMCIDMYLVSWKVLLSISYIGHAISVDEHVSIKLSQPENFICLSVLFKDWVHRFILYGLTTAHGMSLRVWHNSGVLMTLAWILFPFHAFSALQMSYDLGNAGRNKQYNCVLNIEDLRFCY